MQLLSFQKGSRSKILAVVLLSFMAIFVARLFYLQIIMHDDFVKQAAAEHIKPLTIPAERGLIYALDGETPVQLVMNQKVYTLFADPSMITEPEKALEVVRRVAGGNLRQGIDKMIYKKNTRYQILGTHLTRRQAEMIKKEELSGIGFQATTQRVYPEGGLAAQTLGFVNAEGVGQYGVEEELNDRLVGHDGLLKSVTDVSGVPLTIGNQNIHKPAKNGDNIVLTIDRNIQAYTEKALADWIKKIGADTGSIVIMDPMTGKVMSIANLPSYNPAEYTKVMDAAAFNNNVISRPYEPGSDIKTFTMAIGLDKGVIQPDSTYLNTDTVKIEDRTIGNATKGHTGNITMQTALNWSLNTGVVNVAQRLGDGEKIDRDARNTLYDYYHNRFGFGKPTGIEIAGERAGIVISPKEHEGNAVRYSNMTFGQGMDLTMIQVASAFGSLVNGGKYYAPTIIAGTVNPDGSFKKEPIKAPKTGIISSDAADKIHQMIRTARSTFYESQDRKGYDIGGKTGTSQTIVNGKYVDNQTIATYLGYGGNETPRYVIMVEVSGKDKNLQGNKHALPVFTQISNWLIDYLKLQPIRG